MARRHAGAALSASDGRRRVAVCRCLAAVGLAAILGPATSAPPVVLGQSLPLSGPGFPIANRVLAGARAAVESVNAAGGVHGRPVELITLDDGGDAQRTADNAARLAQRHGALAVLNCLGEAACRSAAAATRRAGTPLVGPLSGDPALRAPELRHVFTMRADHRREALLLRRQLQTLGVHRVVLVGDDFEPAREEALAAEMQQGGIAAQRVRFAGDLAAAMRTAAANQPQAAVLSLGPQSLDALGRADSATALLPPLVTTTSGIGLTQLTRLLRDRALGFTTVVPNPEASQLPLVREFERIVEANGSPEAISFEGLAGYLHVQVCIQALRASAKAAGDPAELARALAALGRVNLGGFDLRFAPGQHHGSDFVEIGVRSRDGRARR